MLKSRSLVVALGVFAVGFVAGQLAGNGSTANAQSPKVFELRTYTAPEGKLPNLLARFRDHTLEIFERHGYETIETDW